MGCGRRQGQVGLRSTCGCLAGDVEGEPQVISVDDCVDEVLKRGLEDWIQAAEVVSVVQSVAVAATCLEVRRVALEVIVELVRRELMKAGCLTLDGFVEWAMTPSDAAERIVEAWSTSDRLPGLGEICWLSNTKSGDLRALALLHQNEQ